MSVTGSTSSQLLIWKGRGFQIHIPGDALARNEKCTITLATSFSGQFVLPSNTAPVSAVFYVEPSTAFHKPITLEIEHCYRQEQNETKQLVFAWAHSSSKTPPYRFQCLQGGSFSPNRQSGQIKVSKFSLFTILTTRSSDCCQYCMHVFYQRYSTHTWRVALVVTKKLKESLKVTLAEGRLWH